MSLYVVFVGVSMVMAGLLPWMLEEFHYGSSSNNESLLAKKLYSNDVEYVYNTNNSYSFCPKHKIVHYGFNTMRLPFTFEMLRRPGNDQAVNCMPSTKSHWAKRATDPQLKPQPEYASAPDPPVYLHTHAPIDVCNSYLPSSNSVGLERLLWMVQYLVASGFYVVLDYHPTPDDPTAMNVKEFAESWLILWAAVTCLPNFSTDIRGRVLLDLLNDPDKLGLSGISWNRANEVPGLDQLYLSAMDSIEHITPGDALFLLQGSAMANKSNAFGLSSGDGFVTDDDLVHQYGLSDPGPFFDQLLTRTYRGRVMLAPHMYGPDNSKVPAALPEQVLSRLNSSWGTLAVDGYCNAANKCLRLPVIAGEMGSRLDSPEELSYFEAIAALATAVPASSSRETPVLSGWIWWAYNANSNGTGGLVTDDWQHFLWPKVRFLVNKLGLRPWYKNPEAFVKSLAADQAEALRVQALSDAAVDAHRAAQAAVSNVTTQARSDSLSPGSFLNLTDLGLAELLDHNSSDAPGISSTDAAYLNLDVPAVVETFPESKAATYYVPAVVEPISETETEVEVPAGVDVLEKLQPSRARVAPTQQLQRQPLVTG
eukprot:gene8523-8705_t